MLKADNLMVTPISGISDPANVRVVIFANNRFIHAPLGEILKPLQEKIDALTAHIEKLEGR